MASIETIQGVWKVVTYEQNGIVRLQTEINAMAHLIILSEKLVVKSDGIWGSIKYMETPTTEIVIKSIHSLKELIARGNHENNNAFHIYSCGIIRVETEGASDNIDFVYCRGVNMNAFDTEYSTNRGLFKSDGIILILCLADSGCKQRPTDFCSSETPYQSLAKYIRTYF